ncbi:hypothetical protein J6590_042199 [Homalodisca vitripennis]|nr:hypothetical protein J6590_042199 [Homalodisca vitripennis]
MVRLRRQTKDTCKSGRSVCQRRFDKMTSHCLWCDSGVLCGGPLDDPLEGDLLTLDLRFIKSLAVIKILQDSSMDFVRNKETIRDTGVWRGQVFHNTCGRKPKTRLNIMFITGLSCEIKTVGLKLPSVDRARDRPRIPGVCPGNIYFITDVSFRLAGLYLLAISYSYEARGKESYRAEQHRIVAFERLPSKAGVKFLNRLPEGLIQSDNLNQFKALLKRLLVSNAFYSVEEFMAGCWENQNQNLHTN